jgi:hypothetical protein
MNNNTDLFNQAIGQLIENLPNEIKVAADAVNSIPNEIKVAADVVNSIPNEIKVAADVVNSIPNEIKVAADVVNSIPNYDEYLKWVDQQVNTKPFYTSKIFMSGIGLVATSASTAMAHYGFDVPAEIVLKILLSTATVIGLLIPYFRKYSISKTIR